MRSAAGHLIGQLVLGQCIKCLAQRSVKSIPAGDGVFVHDGSDGVCEMSDPFGIPFFFHSLHRTIQSVLVLFPIDGPAIFLRGTTEIDLNGSEMFAEIFSVEADGRSMWSQESCLMRIVPGL